MTVINILNIISCFFSLVADQQTCISIHSEQNEKKHSFSGHFRPHVYYKETDQRKHDDLDDMIWSILYDLFVQSSYVVLHPCLSFYQCHLLQQDKKKEKQKFESVRREVVWAITQVFNSTDANQYEDWFLIVEFF